MGDGEEKKEKKRREGGKRKKEPVGRTEKKAKGSCRRQARQWRLAEFSSRSGDRASANGASSGERGLAMGHRPLAH